MQRAQIMPLFGVKQQILKAYRIIHVFSVVWSSLLS